MRAIAVRQSDYNTLRQIVDNDSSYRDWIRMHPQYGRVGFASAVRWLLVQQGYDVRTTRTHKGHQWAKYYNDCEVGDYFYAPSPDKHEDGSTFWHALTMHMRRTGKEYRAVPGHVDQQESDGTWWRRFERTL